MTHNAFLFPAVVQDLTILTEESIISAATMRMRVWIRSYRMQINFLPCVSLITMFKFNYVKGQDVMLKIIYGYEHNSYDETN